MVTERAALQASTAKAIAVAAKECDDARDTLERVQANAVAAVASGLDTVQSVTRTELLDQHEVILASQKRLHEEALSAVQAQAAEGQRAMLQRLDEIQRESAARHRHTAASLGEAVKALHVRRETELNSVASEHASALGVMRDEYETHLKRQAKHAEEVLNAEKARAEQAAADAAAGHEAAVAQLETEKRAIAEERAKGWAHLPLPDLLKNAMGEGLEALKAAHEEHVAILEANHAEEMRKLHAERDGASGQAKAALAAQAKAAENDLQMALGEARLQHEEERTRLMEELNLRAENEISLAEGTKAELAQEVERLEAEVRTLKASGAGRPLEGQASMPLPRVPSPRWRRGRRRAAN